MKDCMQALMDIHLLVCHAPLPTSPQSVQTEWIDFLQELKKLSVQGIAELWLVECTR